MHSRHPLPALCLLLTLCVAAFPQIALAKKENRNSSDQQVAIAFFQTAGTNPDFERWAKNAPEYKRLSTTRAKDFLYEESQRLMRLWQDYNPDRDLISVEVPVSILLKGFVKKDGEEESWMYMTIAEQGAVYFPFKYMDYSFAVVPQMIESLMIQQLTPQQYAMMYADFARTLEGEAKLLLHLKPTKAYVNQPYLIDQKEQWVLVTDVVSMTLRSEKDDSILWNYGADWYVAPRTKELRDLYQAPGTDQTTGQSYP